jgi:hypothetical protein
MFFTDAERSIYKPAGLDAAHDPLVVLRKLQRATKFDFDAFLMDYNLGFPPEGGNIDQKEPTKAELERSAAAQEILAQAARAAFDLPAFPETTEAVALETLFDFLNYIEKKGSRGETQLGG